ncbi:MAG TPA: hypothetical protein DCZ95_10820 [Verrucomicrobia bacterium]|nr:hypothetical protein [Verrucomicrobiota bacterium]
MNRPLKPFVGTRGSRLAPKRPVERGIENQRHALHDITAIIQGGDGLLYPKLLRFAFLRPANQKTHHGLNVVFLHDGHHGGQMGRFDGAAVLFEDVGIATGVNKFHPATHGEFHVRQGFVIDEGGQQPQSPRLGIANHAKGFAPLAQSFDGPDAGWIGQEYFRDAKMSAFEERHGGAIQGPGAQGLVHAAENSIRRTMAVSARELHFSPAGAPVGSHLIGAPEQAVPIGHGQRF